MRKSSQTHILNCTILQRIWAIKINQHSVCENNNIWLSKLNIIHYPLKYVLLCVRWNLVYINENEINKLRIRNIFKICICLLKKFYMSKKVRNTNLYQRRFLMLEQGKMNLSNFYGKSTVWANKFCIWHFSLK